MICSWRFVKADEKQIIEGCVYALWFRAQNNGKSLTEILFETLLSKPML